MHGGVALVGPLNQKKKLRKKYKKIITIKTLNYLRVINFYFTSSEEANKRKINCKMESKKTKLYKKKDLCKNMQQPYYFRIISPEKSTHRHTA